MVRVAGEFLGNYSDLYAVTYHVSSQHTRTHARSARHSRTGGQSTCMVSTADPARPGRCTRGLPSAISTSRCLSTTPPAMVRWSRQTSCDRQTDRADTDLSVAHSTTQVLESRAYGPRAQARAGTCLWCVSWHRGHRSGRERTAPSAAARTALVARCWDPAARSRMPGHSIHAWRHDDCRWG